jgi:hypothetical protein
MVIINLGTTWQILRDIMITHNDTRDTMVLELLSGPLKIPLAANATGCIAVLIADTLLVRHDDISGNKVLTFCRYGGAMCCGGATRSSWPSSRCYCSEKSVRDIFVLTNISITDCFSALIPILLVLNANLGPGKVSIICLFFFLSIGITVLATGLIMYRIADVSKRSRGEITKYQYAMEVLVESGVMYSVTLLISGVLLAVRGNDFTHYTLVQASSYWGGILTPVTVNIAFIACGNDANYTIFVFQGIAPTLITMRIVSGTARDETTWTQPVSGMVFNHTPRGHTGQSSTFNASETALKGYSTHNASKDAASSVERKPSHDSFAGHESDMVFRKENLAITPGTAV